MSAVRAALVPGVPALLPAYAGRVDPVAPLRAACCAAVRDLVASDPDRVLVAAMPARDEDVARGVSTSTGALVAQHLLTEAGCRAGLADGWTEQPGERDVVLLVGNGSACRSEKAPGHLDGRAAAFDDALARTITDGAAPPDDVALAEELWCFDLPVLTRLHQVVAGAGDVRYADDPYGVAYWVATWTGLREEVGR